jgi:hypothetical protein
VLAGNDIWWLVCAALPLVIGAVRFVLTKLDVGKGEEKEGQGGFGLSRDELCEIENRMLARIFIFISFTMCAGVMFFHLASVCGVSADANVVFGKWIITPIAALILCIGVTAGLYVLWIKDTYDDCNCCGATWRVFYECCPCRLAQVGAEYPR